MFNPIPNGPATQDVEYKHFDDGSIMKIITTKQLFAGLPTKAILKEEQERNTSNIIKKTAKNQKARDTSPNPNSNKTIIKTLVTKIRQKAPHHTSSVQVMIAALLGYNLALNELENFNIQNQIRLEKNK